jgi:hypothetical protein
MTGPTSALARRCPALVEGACPELVEGVVGVFFILVLILLITGFRVQAATAGDEKTHDRCQPWVLVESVYQIRQAPAAEPPTMTRSVICRIKLNIDRHRIQSEGSGSRIESAPIRRKNVSHQP